MAKIVRSIVLCYIALLRIRNLLTKNRPPNFIKSKQIYLHFFFYRFHFVHFIASVTTTLSERNSNWRLFKLKLVNWWIVESWHCHLFFLINLFIFHFTQRMYLIIFALLVIQDSKLEKLSPTIFNYFRLLPSLLNYIGLLWLLTVIYIFEYHTYMFISPRVWSYFAVADPYSN